MQVKFQLHEYLSLLAFAKGKQTNINKQNLYKFGYSRTIDNRESPFVRGLFCLHLLIAKTIFDKGLLFKYLRIAGSELVSEKLTRVVAASVFVDYNQ